MWAGFRIVKKVSLSLHKILIHSRHPRCTPPWLVTPSSSTLSFLPPSTATNRVRSLSPVGGNVAARIPRSSPPHRRRSRSLAVRYVATSEEAVVLTHIRTILWEYTAAPRTGSERSHKCVVLSRPSFVEMASNSALAKIRASMVSPVMACESGMHPMRAVRNRHHYRMYLPYRSGGAHS
jgi:hypothetical protein